jgi:hypothetical protein
MVQIHQKRGKLLMSQIQTDNELQIIRIERDKQLDVFIAHLREITNPLETKVASVFDGNILFKVDSVTGELVQIFIYDFSIIRRKLLINMVFLYTATTLKNWLKMLAASFNVGKNTKILVHS